ncbi:hypothetical protein Kpol_1013p70 [Vanderwaltozyma polyspora DSM 70294]|uniref:VanZ-like domain-containing protein n=1 Tax=Vanderwaltozyma polyspora (strain ATCC 22028 / DSM 70294 / BCRC 21397 / CBS 2163 / NBRC 10782 / NRRL Y-8283 / UCD 57-17) TaxID=436907 RepID=A7THB4_VANPO|nr:uncharacterized protein Kpol_1013p70 [Vanderwaltozyma polyspora DSM 70294]EDO18395.1 hypothetical protein Kpol_1013p70 [Vanderwaltozyma polyspora DSM 70294]
MLNIKKCLTSNEQFALLTSEHDKLAHFLVFAFESWLFNRIIDGKYIKFRVPQFCHIGPTGWLPLHNINNSNNNSNSSNVYHNGILEINKYIVAFVICSIGAAISSEFLQQWLSQGRRSFDLLDMVCNFIGSILGIGIAYYQEK